MKKLFLIGSLLLFADVAMAQDTATQRFTPEQVKSGSQTYAQHCAACHGPRLADPEGSFDLRTFPHDQKNRFLTSVTKGKNSMPPWGGLLKPEEIEALWAYVVVGEKR